MAEPWKCAECGSLDQPPGKHATICKKCLSNRMSASKPTYEMFCVEDDCKRLFLAKSKNAKRCPDCREKKANEYKERFNKPLPVPTPEPKTETAAPTQSHKREIDIKMKGVCFKREGLLEELSKLVEMVGTWEAGEIQFAIYLRAK